MDNLKGKSVLVVGGSSGIGLGVAQVALAAGADVIIASRSPAKLEAAAKFLAGKARTRILDASQDSQVESFFADSHAFDHVVASAGMGGRGRLADIPMATAYAAMDAKFWVYFRLARSARIAPGGTMTFVSGSLGTKAAAASAPVSATNAAVEALARGLALDLAPIRVNVISPGVVETPLWDQFSEERRREFFAATSQRLPARRIDQPIDIGHAVLFCMTNPFLTGQIIQVDGGSGILPGTGH